MKACWWFVLAALVLGFPVSSADAHPGHEHGRFGQIGDTAFRQSAAPSWSSAAQSGLLHPFSGWDHLLLLAAAGLVNGRFPRTRRIALGGAFTLAMVIGGAMGSGLAVLPGGHWMIALAFVLVAVVLSRAESPSTAFAAALFVAAGTLHGLAHHIELGSPVAAASYWAGMAVSTMAILLVASRGAQFVSRLSDLNQNRVWKAAGSLAALAGVLVSLAG